MALTCAVCYPEILFKKKKILEPVQKRGDEFRMIFIGIFIIKT